jgi:UDP-N-acetylglucosamine 4,6-dehydratase/5-epimerase
MMTNLLQANSILVTGGTGSFGKAFITKVIKDYPLIKRIVVYSRDELKQWELSQQFPSETHPQLRFFLGDVRDKERLLRALEGIDTVIHAAALKQVPATEYNPFECIKTNVIGAENVVQASIESSVKRVIALSTDKASAPINIYGASKLCSDKLFIAANNIKGDRDLVFSVVRYGNVMGSRGSVIPHFIKQAKSGIITLTDSRMTRFNITLQDGVDMVLWSLKNALGGEIFVPKIPSYRITDIATAIAPSCEHRIIGIRPGEKLHEQMIISADSPSTIDLGSYYAILPSDQALLSLYHDSGINYEKVAPGFIYSSEINESFLDVKTLRDLIKTHVSSDFEPI